MSMNTPPNVGSSRNVPVLSKDQLSWLIPLVPLLLDWLSHTTLYSADLFLQTFEQDYSSVAYALEELVQLIDESQQLDPSYADLSQLLPRYGSTVWANAVRLVLAQSNPKIVPPELGSELVGTIPRLNSSATVNEVCHILGPYLDKLPRSNFDALASFCALARDRSSDSAELASLVGPQLLIPNITMNPEVSQGPAALAASAVFHLLILEAESLFGRSAAKRVRDPFGSFGFQPAEKEDGRIDFKRWKDGNYSVLKRSLRAFLDWRDPKNVKQVQQWFQVYSDSMQHTSKVYPAGDKNHDFLGTLAEDLNSRYGQIPPGWDQFLHLGVVDNKVKRAELKEAVDVLNEICNMERTYNAILNAFLEGYVKTLRDISEGKQTDDARNALNLDHTDISMIFGDALENARSFSNKLLAELNILLLQKGPLMGKGRGRTGILIDGFGKVFSQDLSLLESFFVNMTRMQNLLIEKVKACEKQNRQNNTRGGAMNFLRNGGRKKGRNFLEIWEIERVKNDVLKTLSLENVFIKPVQRIGFYKTQLEKLYKKTESSHPAKEDVKTVMDKVNEAGNHINSKMKAQEKVNKMLFGIKN